MEEELQKQENLSVQTEQITSVEQEKQALGSFPRIEELRKSEQDVKVNTQIEGTTQVEHQTQTKDRIFTRKEDERKVLFKKRKKIVAVVYSSVLALLMAFAITNTVVLARKENYVETKTTTIEQYDKELGDIDKNEAGTSLKDFQISINEPRDYSEDEKELTLLDKLTILFRNIFS